MKDSRHSNGTTTEDDGCCGCRGAHDGDCSRARDGERTTLRNRNETRRRDNCHGENTRHSARWRVQQSNSRNGGRGSRQDGTARVKGDQPAGSYVERCLANRIENRNHHQHLLADTRGGSGRQVDHIQRSGQNECPRRGCRHSQRCREDAHIDCRRGTQGCCVRRRRWTWDNGESTKGHRFARVVVFVMTPASPRRRGRGRRQRHVVLSLRFALLFFCFFTKPEWRALFSFTWPLAFRCCTYHTFP